MLTKTRRPLPLLNLVLALLSAALLILSFPRFGFTWLAPVALTPLLIAAARQPFAWRRFLMGEAAGIVYWFGVCYWIQFVLSHYGGMSEVGGWGAFLLFCIVKAVHLGVFTLLAGYLMEKPYAIPAVAALWVGIERTHGTFGFAWLTLGNAGIEMSLPMRLAPWVGVYGLSFLFAMLATALALIFMRRPRRELAWLVVIPLLWLLPALPAARKPTKSVTVVQPNISTDQRWSRARLDAITDRLVYLSMQSALSPGVAKPEMIIWPEVPAPFYYESDIRFRDAANNLAKRTGTYFLFGTVAYTKDESPLNSAQLINPDGQPAGRYDKVNLVPFGEFVPPLFGFVNRITREAGDFVPGSKIVVERVGNHRIGTFICYEAVFPNFVRRFAAAGAQLLVNLSNDGYFGHSAARYQHLLIARMRAAENRRWLIRSTNNGITVAIDPAGRIRERLPPDTLTAARLKFNYINSTTFYTRHGDWFAWLCLGLGLLGVLVAQIPVYRR